MSSALPASLPTPSAADCRTLSLSAWRAVEAQHRVATMRLVDNDPAQQAILEQLLEGAKPPLPPETEGLHWLLATPFRYPPWGSGSRFRGPHDPGVLYGAEARSTACAECGYWRWRFVQASAGLRQLDAHPMSLFSAQIVARTIDLLRPPFSEHAAQWTAPDNYTATQQVARQARAASAQAIAYSSVRDPAHGLCVALLDPGGLVPGQAPQPETWFLTVTPGGTVWQRNPQETLHFSFA